MNEARDSGEASIPVLTLFVTGSAPRSERARANLARMLERIGRSDLTPREVDLLDDPQTGINQSVFATPSLLKTSSNGEVSVLYGDLSDEERLREFLAELTTDT